MFRANISGGSLSVSVRYYGTTW